MSSPPDLVRTGALERADAPGQRSGEGLMSITADLSLAHPDRAKRWRQYASWIFLFSLIFIRPLGSLARLSLSHDEASYILFIPFISASVLISERRKIWSDLSYDKRSGETLVFLAVCIGLVSRFGARALSADLQLSGYILSLVLFWISGFALIFGKAAFKAARFSLLFLFLMIPLPEFFLDKIIYLLQVGSAWIAGALFDLLGVPVLRTGLVFHLATVSIEVAKECSSIRSSLAVLIVTLLAVHLFLRSIWKKLLFLASGLFIMILKNGIRIASLTLLAIYVDPGFLDGRLHRQGGVVFFILGLLLLLPLLRILQYGEPLAEKNREGGAQRVPNYAISQHDASRFSSS